MTLNSYFSQALLELLVPLLLSALEKNKHFPFSITYYDINAIQVISVNYISLYSCFGDKH